MKEHFWDNFMVDINTKLWEIGVLFTLKTFFLYMSNKILFYLFHYIDFMPVTYVTA